MFHWGLLGGGVALSLVTGAGAGAAPSPAQPESAQPVSEIEIAELRDEQLTDLRLILPSLTATPLTIGQVGEMRETAFTFGRVMDLLQQASTSSDGQQFSSQVSVTALQLALLLEHYSSEIANRPTYQELHRANAIGRQFVPDAVTELPAPLPDITATPDGVPGASAAVVVTAPPVATELPIATRLPVDSVLPVGTVVETGSPEAVPDGAASDGENAAPEMLEGEVAEVLTEVNINGRTVKLAAITWDDVAYAAVYLASLMSPDNLNAAAVSITLPELEMVELAGEEVEFASPAELINNLIAKYSKTTEGYANGYLPADILCEIPWAPAHQSRCDAAGSLIALNEAFKAEFGYNLPIGSSYRPFETQIQLALTKPHLAATPGTSMHGWGLAIDFGVPIFGGTSAEYQWMLQNAPTYGWDNPLWARVDGRKPEPWHFEFMAGKPNNSNWQATTQVAFPVGGAIVPAEPQPSEPGNAPAALPNQSVTPAAVLPPAPPVKPAEPRPTPSATPATSEPNPSPTPTPSPSPSPTPSPSPAPSPTPSPGSK